MTASHAARARASGDWRGPQNADRRGDSMTGTARTTAARSSPMVSVYDGRTCLGLILARGKLGFEPFTRDEHSLGLFKTPREAADAISDDGMSQGKENASRRSQQHHAGMEYTT